VIEVAKKKPRAKPHGRPFPKGVSGNFKGRPTKFAEANKTFAERFIGEMFKEVDALIDGRRKWEGKRS